MKENDILHICTATTLDELQNCFTRCADAQVRVPENLARKIFLENLSVVTNDGVCYLKIFGPIIGTYIVQVSQLRKCTTYERISGFDGDFVS